MTDKHKSHTSFQFFNSFMLQTTAGRAVKNSNWLTDTSLACSLPLRIDLNGQKHICRAVQSVKGDFLQFLAF